MQENSASLRNVNQPLLPRRVLREHSCSERRYKPLACSRTCATNGSTILMQSCKQAGSANMNISESQWRPCQGCASPTCEVNPSKPCHGASKPHSSSWPSCSAAKLCASSECAAACAATARARSSEVRGTMPAEAQTVSLNGLRLRTTDASSRTAPPCSREGCSLSACRRRLRRGPAASKSAQRPVTRSG